MRHLVFSFANLSIAFLKQVSDGRKSLLPLKRVRCHDVPRYNAVSAEHPDFSFCAAGGEEALAEGKPAIPSTSVQIESMPEIAKFFPDLEKGRSTPREYFFRVSSNDINGFCLDRRHNAA